VFVAAFIASVYLMGLLASAVDLPTPLALYARLADHFELLGYLVVGAFLTTWLGAAAIWRYGHFEEKRRRYFVRGVLAADSSPRHPSKAASSVACTQAAQASSSQPPSRTSAR
jgi:hypothetical protein